MAFQTHTIHRGATGVTVLVVAQAGGAPIPGLGPDSSGIRAGFVRSDGAKGAIDLVPGVAGQWVAGGWVEVDPDLAPGVYQFGLPDELLAAGAVRAVVVIQAPGVVVDPVDIDLVAFDPQEPERIGMESLAFEQRLKCLTTAFPLLAAQEQERLRARESPA